MVAWYDIESEKDRERGGDHAARPAEWRAPLAEALDALRRGAPAVAATAAVFCLAVGLLLVFVAPEFAATARLQVDGREAESILQEVETGEALTDRMLASAAADLGLAANKASIDLLRRRTAMVAERAGRSIAVVARSSDPETAARIANAVADAFRARRLDQAAEAAERATLDLARRIEELGRRVADAEPVAAAREADDAATDGRRRQAEAEIASSRALVESFRQRLRDLQADERNRILALRLLADAEAPDYPVWPPTIAFLALAALVGALAGAAFVLHRAARADRFRSPEDLESALGLPCLATVPAVEPGFFAPAEPAKLAVAAPKSPYAAAIRGLEAGLSLADTLVVAKIVLLTGPVPTEDRAALAASVARVAAGSGRHGRVALIEAEGHFAGRGRAAIEDYIGEKAALDDLIGADPATGLSVLRARDIALAFRAPGFRALLRALAERFDLIVVDAPPVLAPADARRAAEIADLALLVVGWATTPRRRALDCARMLGETGMRLGSILAEADLGLVLAQGAPPAQGVAFRRYYGD